MGRTCLTDEERHDRAVRMLAARLEYLAAAEERATGGLRLPDEHVLAAEAATRHAIALGLITSEEAAAVWADVAERHPDVPWCRRPAAA
jgi:hypothetical protein